MADSATRLCPLCDDYLADEVCPKHKVPTIAATAPFGQAAVRLEPGSVIAERYRLDSMLGQGGMGLIFQSTHLSTNEIVVLKLLRDESLAQRTYLRRFYQEARAIALLNHPNIVRIIEFGFDAPARVPFLVMERVEGRTLRELIVAEGPLTVEKGCSIMLQVSKALLEAHDKGVLHRDLKPDNIMVRAMTDGGTQVKVLDFGLAKLLEGEGTMPPLTIPGRVVGTPSYMAPEQVIHATQDFRTDLYGLGCVLHAILAGRAPFFGGDRLEVMRRKVREPPPGLPARLPCGETPPDSLKTLHAALLATDRLDRPRSTQEVVSALASIAEESRRGKKSAANLISALNTEIASRAIRIPDVDTMPAVPVRVLPDFTPEEMVSDAELQTLQAVLAQEPMGEPVSDAQRAASSTPIIPVPVLRDKVPVDPIEGAETLVKPVDIRSLSFALHRARVQSGSGEDQAWTSVLPSSLDPEIVDSPTPTERMDAAAVSPVPVIIRSEPRPVLRRQRPYGVRAGIVLAALSALTGAVLAIAVLRLRPIAPAVDPAVPGEQPRLLDLPGEAQQNEPSPSVSIESVPDRAEVYEGRVLVGLTPVMFVVPPDGSAKQLRLEKEGYEDASVTIDANTKDRLRVELKAKRVKRP